MRLLSGLRARRLRVAAATLASTTGLLLPGVPAESEFVDRFRALAVWAGCEVCGEDVVSMSTGLACYPNDGGSAEQLLETADGRMYECKSSRKRLISV